MGLKKSSARVAVFFLYTKADVRIRATLGGLISTYRTRAISVRDLYCFKPLFLMKLYFKNGLKTKS